MSTPFGNNLEGLGGRPVELTEQKGPASQGIVPDSRRPLILEPSSSPPITIESFAQPNAPRLASAT